MDEDRRIRFLVSPALFIASLLFGAWFDPSGNWIVETLKNPASNWPKLIGLLTGGGVVVFAAGYVFGTFTYFFLRLLFRYRPQNWGKSRFHEIALSDDAFKQVWKRLRARPVGEPDRERELFAGVAFDHGVLWETHKGIHQCYSAAGTDLTLQ